MSTKKPVPTLTRREFLERGFTFAGTLLLPANLAEAAQKPPAHKPLIIPAPRTRTHQSPAGKLNSGALEKFVDPLPIPPIAKSATMRASPANSSVKVPFYRMSMRQIDVKVHRDLPSTRMWGFNGSCPGPTLETRTGQPILVEWANDLPSKHLLEVDHSIHGAHADVPDVRAVVHLHGGRTPAESDGYPESWYVPGKSALYYYPNQQDPAMLWYHDHTLGINRLNVFAGLAGAYFVRNRVEDALPLPRGKYEVPLVIFDRAFTRYGQLAYPSKWMNEFAGDAVLVNGKMFPYLEVEPRRYRLRLVNAANSRVFDFSLSNGQTFYQIGTDQGLLPAAVELEHFSLAPGERADLVVDFAGQAGKNIVLLNDDRELPHVMQFRVGRSSAEKDTSQLPAALRPVRRMPEALAVKTRRLTLSDVIGSSDVPTAMLLNNARWSDPVTEKPVLNSVEIWELVNITDETHPIHLHMVRFQVLDRRRFDVLTFQEKGEMHYAGRVITPEPHEMGWKDTVQARQGMVTRIIVRFDGFAGRYVWHCHILEHEDNEMMRPFDVLPV